MRAFAFVFFLVRSATALLGELSLDCDPLGFRSVEPDAKGRCTIPLVDIAFARVPFAKLAFAKVPFAKLAFPTLGDPFAEIRIFEAFAMLSVRCETVDVGKLRGVLPGVVVGFVVLDAATNNSGVTEGVTSVAVFPAGLFAGVCVVVVLLPGTFAALLLSISLSSEGMNSSS